MPDNPTTLHRAMEHCRKAHDNNCVMDVGDHDGIPCNAENCIAYREVVEASEQPERGVQRSTPRLNGRVGRQDNEQNS